MDKSKKTAWGLKVGHPTSFRRTVTVGGKPKLLVLQPDTRYELGDAELAGLAREIQTGLLVRWDEDPKGRRVDHVDSAGRPRRAQQETRGRTATSPPTRATSRPTC